MKQFINCRVLVIAENMSATISNSRWNGYLQSRPATSGNPGMFTRVGVEPRAMHCPSCNSIVYSRRHRRCGACGENLPDDCLFTGGEARNVEMLMRAERERHRVWLEKSRTCHELLTT